MCNVAMRAARNVFHARRRTVTPSGSTCPPGAGKISATAEKEETVKTSRIRLGVAAAAVALAAVAGCGGSSGGDNGGGGGGNTSGNPYGAKKDDTIAKSVPQKFASKGTLVVASDPTYP